MPTLFVDARMLHGVGALTGYLSGGRVSNCYVKGGLVLGGFEETGGLIGYNDGSVARCCVVDGTVIGITWVGGLVGGSGGDIVNCYIASSVRGQSLIGGLVGRDDRRGNVTASFFDGDSMG